MKLRPGPANKAILIGTDGASMELWRRMAASGRAPNMKKLLENVEGGIVYEALEKPDWYLRA